VHFDQVKITSKPGPLEVIVLVGGCPIGLCALFRWEKTSHEQHERISLRFS